MSAQTELRFSPAPPAGMRVVTKAEFLACLSAETRDVHSRPEEYHHDYYLASSRAPWGWVSRGWNGPFDYQGVPAVYALADAGGAA